MKRYFSITFALLAVAGAGWFVSTRPASGVDGADRGPSIPVMVRGQRPTAGRTGNDRVSASEVGGMKQGTEFVNRAGFTGSPPATRAVSGVAGVSSPFANDSSSSRKPLPFSALNQTRPSTMSNERTRSRSSYAAGNPERSRRMTRDPLPSKTPFPADLSKKIKSPDPEKANPQEVLSDKIAAAISGEDSEPDRVPEIPVVITPDPPQPAVWVDLGAASALSKDKQDEIQNLAESLSQKITASGLDPASPEYRQVWEEAVADSDQVFRQRYGNQAWLAHHVQAYHLAHAAEEQGP